VDARERAPHHPHHHHPPRAEATRQRIHIERIHREKTTATSQGGHQVKRTREQEAQERMNDQRGRSTVEKEKTKNKVNREVTMPGGRSREHNTSNKP
jgi:hypothetical protein